MKSRIFGLFVLALILMVPFVDVHASLQDGLVAYYPFNGNANDESGNWNNGAVYGATLTDDRFGKPNSAYSFDGVNDYISINDGTNFNFSYSLSISIWVKPNSVQMQYTGIIDKSHVANINGGSCKSFVIQQDDSSTNRFYFGMATRSPNTCEESSGITCREIDPTANNWNHICIVRDYGSVRVSVNGILINSCSGSSEAVVDNGSLPLSIGAVNSINGRGRFFNGIIDDIRIYNRDLSESEVQQLYLEGTNRPPTITSFTATPTSGNPPLTVKFNCSASDPDGSISQYRWVFGDGENHTTTTGSITHAYPDLGTFNAKVTVVDNDGAKTTSSPIPIIVAHGPDLTGSCEEYLFYNATKKIQMKLKVTNKGNMAAGPFKVSLNLSNNGTTPLTPAFKEVSVASGLGVGKSTTLSISHTFATSIYGKYLLIFIDSGKKVAEVDETNNGNRIVVQPMTTK